VSTTPSPVPAELSKLRLGTAPDSWGVWYPDDPAQVPWTRYLDEVERAGYAWTELGPYGYLPTDPGILKDELDRRGLTLTGGTVAAALHRGPDALEAARRACDLEAATLGPLGARYVILLPEADRTQAMMVAERLRSAVAGHTFLADRGLSVRFTASFGVATWPLDGRKADELLGRADAAMYQVKGKARDAVAHAGGTGTVTK